MRGTVQYDRERKTWYYRHELPPGEGGKRRQTTKRGFRRRREAEDALARALWELGAGPVPERSTVPEWAERELTLRAPGLSPVTVANDKRFGVACLRASPLGDLPVSHLDTEAMGRLRVWLTACHDNPVTIRTHWRSIAALLRPLADAGHLPAAALKAGCVPARVRPPDSRPANRGRHQGGRVPWPAVPRGDRAHA